MKKLFRRREFLTRRTRDMAEAFITAWIVRSWLDRDWGGAGTWLWWLNFSLSSAVSLSMFVLLFTKAKAEPPAPTEREIVDRYLEHNRFMLITREQAEHLIPGVHATPYVAPDAAVFVNPAVLQRLIDTWPKPGSMMFNQPQGTEYPKGESVPEPKYQACGKRFGRVDDCPVGYPAHECERNKAHLIGPDPRCLCKCGKVGEIEPS